MHRQGHAWLIFLLFISWVGLGTGEASGKASVGSTARVRPRQAELVAVGAGLWVAAGSPVVVVGGMRAASLPHGEHWAALGPLPTPTPAGDADIFVDGRINSFDLLHFAWYWQQSETESMFRSDLENDGKVDEKDLLRLIELLLP